MAAIYTTLANVERVLRTSSESKVRLSDKALVSVIPQTATRQPNLSILVDYTSIVISDDYEGRQLLRVTFTSATDFDVTQADLTSQRELLLGSGDIASPFVTPDTLITIPAGTFSGTIAATDFVELEFHAHMSVNDAVLYIEDTEVSIDSVLSELGVDYLETGDTRLYTTTPDVPVTIAVAAQYLAAYFIYTDVYRGKFTDEATFQNSYARRWKKRADNMLNQFAAQSGRLSPKILSFPSFIDEQGLNAAGGAPGTLTDVVDDITRASGSNTIFEPT